MKLTIEINAKEFERLNYTMSQLADILSGNNFLQNKLDLKQKDAENLEKIKYMETIFGNSYFELLGQTIEKGYSIQEAIDICYEWLTENE